MNDLRGFDTTVVLEVTAFYVVLKGSRDATGSLSRWTEAMDPTSIEKRRLDVINILYLCLLCAEHGKRSLESLLETGPMLDYGVALFTLLEVQAIKALALAFEADDALAGDIRKELVERRQNTMANLIAEAAALGAFKRLRPKASDEHGQAAGAVPAHNLGGAMVDP